MSKPTRNFTDLGKKEVSPFEIGVSEDVEVDETLTPATETVEFGVDADPEPEVTFGTETEFTIEQPTTPADNTPAVIVPEVKETAIVPLNNEAQSFAIQEMVLPSKQEVDAKYEILEYIKKKVVSNTDDYKNINGKPYLLASGTAKFINYFKLKVTYPHREIIRDEDGLHCEFICRVEAPWGQIVDSYGNASMKTMTLGKTRHNMVALSETRARTRAVRIIMGFKEPSYAEMHGDEKRL